MDAVFPFCQSGMTVGNDQRLPAAQSGTGVERSALYGNYEQALTVCTRPTISRNLPPVYVRLCVRQHVPVDCTRSGICADNEYGIIETAYQRRLCEAKTPKVRTGKKVAIIGSGPSGLAAADQLNQRGHQVTVYERDDRVGGLLMYGIPNMKLEKQIIDRKINVMKEEGIKFVTGVNVGVDVKASEFLKEYDRVICCGASNPRDINAPGRDAKGIYFAVDFLKRNHKEPLDSNLKIKNLFLQRAKNVVIIGGGDTGNDCVGTSSSVMEQKCNIQLEMMPKAPDCVQQTIHGRNGRICKDRLRSGRSHCCIRTVIHESIRQR